MTVRFLECRGMAWPLASPVRREKRQRERKFLTVMRVSALLPPYPKIRILSVCPSARMDICHGRSCVRDREHGSNRVQPQTNSSEFCRDSWLNCRSGRLAFYACNSFINLNLPNHYRACRFCPFVHRPGWVPTYSTY